MRRRSCTPRAGAAWQAAWLWLFGLGLTFLTVNAGCSCSADPLATLAEAQGQVERDYEASVNNWLSAAVGATFDFGDAVKTAASSTATLNFDDGARIQLEAHTTIRFQRNSNATDERTLVVESGTAIIETGDKPMRLRTELGLAVLEAGSRVHLGKTKHGLRLLVKVGLALLDPGGKNESKLVAGEQVEIGIGMAILDSSPDERDAVVPDVESPTLPPAGSLPIRAVISGRGTLVLKPGSKKYVALPPGEHVLEKGSKLRLKKRNDVTVKRGKSSATLSGPGTYLITGNNERLVEPVTGNIKLSAQDRDIRLDIPGGSVTALGSGGLSIADVNVGAKGHTRVSAHAGRIRIQHGEQQSTLVAGEHASVSSQGVKISGRGPDYHDVAAQLGASLVIHDAAPPTVVGFSLAQCPHRGVVENMSGKNVVASSAGKARANVAFKRGRHSYRARCISADGEWSKVIAEGQITIYQDAGVSALPSTPPANFVNTDGRAYTLLYQHLLPSVTVRWPNAPAADSYTLTVTSNGKSRTINSNPASYRFRSGTIREGKHSFVFRSAQGRTSRPSTAIVRFDNAAPKANIKAPTNGQFSGGATVSSRGIALPGWKVSAQGQELAMDQHSRFSGSVTAGPRGLVLLFSHPARGIHHYLRRATGAMP